MTTDNTELVFTLLGAAANIERRLDRMVANTCGISFTEYRLLKSLQTRHNGAATRVDLATAVRLTPSAITRALKPLEKIGYVVTEKSSRDARRSIARLTDAAVRVLADTDQLLRDEIATMDIPSDDQQTVSQFLDRVSAA